MWTGRASGVDVALHWVGGAVRSHPLTRPVQRYEQLAGYARLRERIAELRGEGKSMAAVAECLNREGFRPPKRATRFNGGVIAGFLSNGSSSGPRPVALSTAGML